MRKRYGSSPCAHKGGHDAARHAARVRRCCSHPRGAGAKSLLLPSPPVRTVAPGQFDANRAKARLAFILGDQRPHPADSAADDAVRARLIATLRQMGLKPIVRDQFACNDFQRRGSSPARGFATSSRALGPATGKALLLSAHYDSVPAGPGASDDGIGVATLLEVGSILKDRPLKRPVILLFNEGEELGLIGARAFLADPLSRNVDSLLNFEARGVHGPVTMFETNRPNGAAIAAYSRARSSAVREQPFDRRRPAHSQRHRRHDLQGTRLGHAQFRDHRQRDPLSQSRGRSRGSRSEEPSAYGRRGAGARSQPVARASQSSMAIESSSIWISVRSWKCRFPSAPPASFSCSLLSSLSFALEDPRFRAASLVVTALVAGGLAAWLAITIMGLVRSGAYWRSSPEITFLAIYATALLGELWVFRTGATLDTAKLRSCYWLLFLLIGSVLALVAPGAIIYFLIPPAAFLLGVVLSRWFAPAEAIGSIVAVLLLFLTWGELLFSLEVIFSPGPLWIVAPVASIVIAPALIEALNLFKRSDRRMLLTGSAVIVLAAWIGAAEAPAYSEDHQQRFTIEHVTDFTQGRSSWSILNDGAPLPSAYLAAGPWHRSKFDFSERQRWLAPAPSTANVQAPSIEVLKSISNGSDRTVTLRLHAKGAERISLVSTADAHIRSAGIGGLVRPIASDGSLGRFTLNCTGRSCDGAELMITINGTRPVRFTLVGASNGLPPSAAPLERARPPFARPQYTPDETLTLSHLDL